MRTRRNSTVLMSKVFAVHSRGTKMFCGINVFNDEIVVTLYSGSGMKRKECNTFTYEKFQQSYMILNVIEMHAGTNFLNQLLSIIKGTCSGFLYLPESVILKIVEHIPWIDLLRLASTCKYLSKLLRSDEVWKEIYHNFLKVYTKSAYSDIGNGIGNYKELCKQIWLAHKKQVHIQEMVKAKVLRFDKMDLLASTSQASSVKLPPITLQSTASNSNLQANGPQDVIQAVDEFVSLNVINTMIYRQSKVEQKAQEKIDLDMGSGVVKENHTVQREMISPIGYHAPFAPADLRRRLLLLQKNALSFGYDSDDAKPGDLTMKYALKYRSEIGEPAFQTKPSSFWNH